LQIKGSDSLINVVQRLAEDYMSGHPGRIIVVTGGGTGAGIAALINGTCDIANSSRFITQEELTTAKKEDVSIHGVALALDGLCIIVNRKNRVTELTLDQVGAIFRGEIRNWKELGGENLPITLYGRQSNSGAFNYLREMVLKGEYAKKMLSMHSDTQIIESLRHDRGGIGYCSSAFVQGGKEVAVVNIAAQKGESYITPLDPQNIITGKYPLSRPLLQYYRIEKNINVKDFIDYELSSVGQMTFFDFGFIPVPKNYQMPLN